MAVNAITYVRNVGRSFGYAAVDSFNQNNPAMRALVDNNKEVAVQLYQAIKDIKGTAKKAQDKIVKNEYFELASEFKDNLFEDIKSGNFYNKERKDRYQTEMMGDTFNFDFDDINFDDMDFGDNIADDIDINDTIDTVGEKVSNAVSMATARSAEYIVSSNKESTKILYEQNNRLFAQVTSGLLSINSTLNVLTTSMQPLTTHIQNSTVFYTKSTELQTKQVELLQKLVENTTPKVEKKSSSSSRRSGTISDVMSDNAIDLKSYLGVVGDNIKEALDGTLGLLNMFKSEGGGHKQNMLRSVSASPLEFLISNLITTATPKAIKASQKKLNDSLGGLFGTLLMQITGSQYNYNNPVLAKLGEIFGIKNTLKKNVDTSKYEKGKIDFDGITKKAIVEVIPTYLAKIAAALTGVDERYDYQRGKFVSVGSIHKDYKSIVNREADFIGWDIKSEFEKYVKGKDQEQEMMKNLNNYFLNSIEKGDKPFNPRKKYSDSEYLSFGLDPITGKMFSEFMNNMIKDGKGGLNTSFNKDVMISRESITDTLKRIEEEGGILTHLFNGSLGSTDKALKGDFLTGKSPLDFNNMIDENKNNVFFYLRGIYENTGGKRNGYKESKKIYRDSKKSSGKKSSNNSNTSTSIVQKAEVYSEYEYDGLLRGIDKGKNKEVLEYYEYEALSGDEKEDYIKKILELKNNTRSGKKKGLLERLTNTKSLSEKLEVITEGYQDIMEKPAQMVVNVLEKADKTIYDIIYGKEEGSGSGDEEKSGFLGVILKKTTNMFDKMNSWIDTNILDPLKDKFNMKSIKEGIHKIFGIDVDEIKKEFTDTLFGTKDGSGKRQGGVFSNVMNAVSDRFGEVKGWAKRAYSNTLGKVFNGKKEQPSAANGGVVTKTGMIAVSEGEFVVPSEYNPYYHGGKSKRQQMREESNVANRYFGNFSTGGTVGDNFRNWFDDTKGKAFGTKDAPTFLRKSFDELFNAIQYMKDKLIGDPKTQKKEQSEMSKTLKMAFDEAKTPEGISSAITGGIIGGGVSILSGGLISPLLGMSIGAGSGLVIKSKAIQDALFGNEEKDGLIKNKTIVNFLTKKLPSMAEYGFIGGAAGLLPFIPGGPVTGVILGSAIGYAKQSDTIQRALFGDKEKHEGGMFSREFQEKFKKAAPRMGAGAIAGLVAGPFGIVGNIVAGSAIGYATTSDTFKKKLFGDPENSEDEGLFGWIKKDIFTPIKESFKPITHEIGFQLKKSFKGFSRMMYNMFKETIGIPLNKMIKDRLMGPLGKIFGKLINPLKSIISSPFKLLGYIGKRTKQKQIRRGRASYMTAAERLNYRKQNNMGNDRMSSFDEQLAGMSSDDISTLSGYVDTIEDPTKGLQRQAKDTLHGLSGRLSAYDNLKYGDTKKIMDAIKAQNPEKALQLLGKVKGLSDSDKDAIIADIQSSSKQFNDIKANQGDVQGYSAAKMKELKDKYGIDINSKNAWQYKDLLNSESAAKKKSIGPNPQEKGSDVISLIQEVVKQLKIMNGTESKSKYVPTADGKMIKYNQTENGEMEVDLTDSDTAKNLDAIEEKDNAVKETASGIRGLGGTIGGMFTKFFGKDDEKKDGGGFFGMIKNFFGGENGLLTKLGNIGTFLTGGVKGAVLSGILITALGAGLSGKLDNDANAISRIIPSNDPKNSAKGAYHTNTTKTIIDANGKEQTIRVDENGVPLTDNLGNYVSNADGKVLENTAGRNVNSQTAGRSFSSRLWENTIRGFTGKSSLAKTMLKKPISQIKTVGRGVKSGVEFAGKATDAIGKQMGKVVDVAKKTSFMTTIVEQIGKFVNGLKGVPVFAGKGEALDKFAYALTQSVDDIVKKGGGKVVKAIAGAAASFAAFLKIAWVVVDFTTGYEDARSTLGITAEPTIGQKVVSGLIRALKIIIPVIGSLIPDKTLVNLALDVFAPFFGIDNTEIQQQRAQAKAEVEAYNEANGTNYTVEEYNKNVLKDFTWTEKIGNGVKSTIGAIKEKGLGGAVKGYVSEKIDVFKNGMKEGGYTEAIADVIDSIFPKVLADPAASAARMYGLASQGKLKELINFSYTDKDTSLLGKIIGQVSIFFPKIIYTPLALINMIVKDMIRKISNTVKAVMEFAEDPVGNIQKAASFVGEKVSNIGTGIKNFFTGKNDASSYNGKGSFISQTDSQYGSMKYGGSNVANEGCGPAAAAMAVNAAHNKNNIVSMKDTLAYARRNGYENASGTSADYFGDVFGNYGLGTEYMPNQGGQNAGYIRSQIASGTPTVLLGQDGYNTSKNNSPFGPGNHYVVATGMDRKGNIIVNDPESRGPRKYGSGILNNVKLGISASGSRIINRMRRFIGGSSSNKANIWAYFKRKGASDEATAGIIGNLMAESSCDPTAIEKPSGLGHGIAQWTRGRWDNLQKIAKSKGVDWTDLGLQLELLWSEINGGEATWNESVKAKYGSVAAFLQLKNIAEVTEFYCMKFERPKASAAHLDKRLRYAQEAYNEFTGKNITLDLGASTVAGNAIASDGSTSPSNGLEVFNNLGSMFSKAASAYFGKVGSLFGFSSESADSSTSYNGGTEAPATDSSGTVSSGSSNKLVQFMDSVRGKLAYSMSGPRDPEQGSADCSSTVNWAYKKAFGKSIGSNTYDILKNPNTKTVDQSNIGINGGKNGSGPNTSKLQPGDILLYSRPDSGHTAGRDYRVGHVEMYYGNNQTIGHGGPGLGPNVKDINRDANRYIMAKRLIGAGSGFSGMSYTPVNGKGNIVTFPSAGGSKVLNNQYTLKTSARNAVHSLTGQGNADMLIPLIKTIITLLQATSSNTENLTTIVSLLKNYFNAKGSQVNKSTSSTSQKGSGNGNNIVVVPSGGSSSLDDATKELVEMLNKLAM